MRIYLATDEPKSTLDRTLGWVPRLLSSKPHVILLIGLGVYLIVLPLVGVNVSAKSELIGGNYTNAPATSATSAPASRPAARCT